MLRCPAAAAALIGRQGVHGTTRETCIDACRLVQGEEACLQLRLSHERADTTTFCRDKGVTDTFSSTGKDEPEVNCVGEHTGKISENEIADS